MRIFLLILLAALSTSVIGQVQNKLAGTWKVIGMADDEMSFNSKEDSASFSQAADIDTNAAKIMADPLMSLMGEMVFIFERNGHFTVKHNKRIDEGGIYQINSKKSIITLKGKRNGVSSTKEMLFQFKNSNLVLTPLRDTYFPKITLEKLK